MATGLQALKSEFFRVLAHPTRIRILEQLATRELTVQDLQNVLTLDQPIVSQHLAALRLRSVVVFRREGTQAYYALASPLVADVLRIAREFLNTRLAKSQSLLRELQREERRG